MPTNAAFTQWMNLTPMGQQNGGSVGAASQTYPLHGVPEPFFRDRGDALRAGRIPSAEYPDGYLGTIRSRRQDRLVQHAGQRSHQNRRNYERGIHVGARVDPQNYFWTEDFNPQSGLEAQAAGVRFAPRGPQQEVLHLANGGKPVVRGAQSILDPMAAPPSAPQGASISSTPSPERTAALQRLLPRYRS